MKTVLITQSNYIPWKGYFDSINKADLVILYDDAQFTKRDWRNRNKIKSAQGLLWLTIPVLAKGRYFQKINETEISEPTWAADHWKTLLHCYKKAKFFDEVSAWLEPLYTECKETNLSRLNRLFLETVSGKMGIQTEFHFSSQYHIDGDATDKLINICKQAGATKYLSGPAAKGYLAEDRFEASNIQLEYLDYSDYPVYSQLHGEFVHEVSVLDLLFNEGPCASQYMKSFDASSLSMARSSENTSILKTVAK